MESLHFLEEIRSREAALHLKHIIKCRFSRFGQITFFFLSLKDLEVENMDQKSAENDSHKQNSEEDTSASQDVGAVSEEPEEGESSDVPDPDSLSPAHADSDSVSGSHQDSSVPGADGAGAAEPACAPGDSRPQEHTGTQPSSKGSWDNKAQPMESILADWNEDIEAFEMMEKDEL